MKEKKFEKLKTNYETRRQSDMEKIIEIPEGYEARIDGNKVILESKESEDEIIRKALVELVRKHCVNETRCMMEEWLEKQRSQNLANSAKTCKDEPKFKVGDWVVYNDDICQIVKREEGCNKLVTNFGIDKELVNERNLSTARLWTIQDAKDGDVLATLDYILIFKKRLPKAKDGGVSYCHYDFGSENPQFIWSEDKNWYFGKEAIIHPATKEQRSLLFQKMKEAGYEWDAEKKELRKIEQKPSTSVAEFDTEVEKFCKESFIKDTNEKGKVFCIARHFADWQKNRQNTAWSEEDEQEFNVMKSELEKYIMLKQYGTPLSVNDIEWFKSLKNRVQPQTKPVWSEEDERTLNSILNDLSQDVIPDEEGIQWLKSLKERYTWKPSDEQLEALEHSLGDYNIMIFEDRFEILTSLYDDLEKLKG